MREQTIYGSYTKLGGIGYSSIDLKKDSSFVQFVSDCTYAIKVIGKWKIYKDTIILLPKTIFTKHPDRRDDTPIVDTANAKYKIALGLTKYLIQSDTSICLLKKYNGQYLIWRTLIKQKSK